VDYIYLNDQPIATIQPSIAKVYFLHDDRLGTPQLATDASQTVQWAANYQPFGYTSAGIGKIVQNLRLPGQELDLETGLYQNGFRDYVPGLGRYIETDVIGLKGGTNTYGYSTQNALKFTDRRGSQVEGPPEAGIPPFPIMQLPLSQRPTPTVEVLNSEDKELFEKFKEAGLEFLYDPPTSNSAYVGFQLNWRRATDPEGYIQLRADCQLRAARSQVELQKSADEFKKAPYCTKADSQGKNASLVADQPDTIRPPDACSLLLMNDN
jgi:RHS repeat-associated protein